MTYEQRERIASMRQAGWGYGEIANELGLSANSVKSFCQRRQLGGTRAAQANKDDGASCKQCGKAIVQEKGRKTRKFCSDACRLIWWHAHQDQLQQKALYSHTCVGCGRDFNAYGNKNRRFCTHACYITARFARKVDKPA